MFLACDAIEKYLKTMPQVKPSLVNEIGQMKRFEMAVLMMELVDASSTLTGLCIMSSYARKSGNTIYDHFKS